eukprot:11154053-Alexandrium_andersonii.AAC.1
MRLPCASRIGRLARRGLRLCCFVDRSPLPLSVSRGRPAEEAWAGGCGPRAASPRPLRFVARSLAASWSPPPP